MRTDLCPSDEVLTAFILGDLAEEVLDSVREHQEQCARCEVRRRELDDQVDPVLETIRRTIRGPEGPDWLSGPDGPADKSVPHENWAGAGGASISSGAPGRGRDRALAAWASDVPDGTTGPMAIEATGTNRPILPGYEIGESLLGRGSMGVVYKARHLRLNRVVALKMIAGTSRQASRLFEIEAKAVACLQHPNIVQIFDIGNNCGQPFLVLEFALAFQPAFGNLGYWRSANDRAVWTFQVDRGDTFTLSLDYACHDSIAGNTFEATLAGATFRGVVAGTTSYSIYRVTTIGELELTAGAHRLEVRSAGQPRISLFDLRAVILKPRH